MSNTKTKAVAYVRVSTDKQADEGVSLEAQQEKVRAYAALYDLELVEVIVDAGESAKSLDRPGLQRALQMIKRRQVSALVVVKLDRLTRSVSDLGTLVNGYFKKASLLSVSEQIDTRTVNGRLMLNLLTMIAEWERETIGERTSTAMRHKVKHGQYTGGQAPYGFTLAVDGKTLERNEPEQQVLAAARELRVLGLSLRKVASELSRRGFVARNGKTFAAETVANMTKAAA